MFVCFFLVFFHSFRSFSIWSTTIATNGIQLQHYHHLIKVNKKIRRNIHTHTPTKTARIFYLLNMFNIFKLFGDGFSLLTQRWIYIHTYLYQNPWLNPLACTNHELKKLWTGKSHIIFGNETRRRPWMRFIFGMFKILYSVIILRSCVILFFLYTFSCRCHDLSLSLSCFFALSFSMWTSIFVPALFSLCQCLLHALWHSFHTHSIILWKYAVTI